jgi:hypothetical protein
MEYMEDWTRRSHRWHHNLLALGDFNIDCEGDKRWQAFTSTGLTVPQDLRLLTRTVFSDLKNPTLDKYYDQIAWFQTGI